MISLAGKILRYEYENGEAYQILFHENSATWTSLAGTAAGMSGTEQHDVIEVASNVLFVSWLESSGEVVSLVANLNTQRVYVSYVYENTRHFWKGEIKYFGYPED